VLGVGFGDYRKGFDLFIKSAQNFKDKIFMWVGNISDEMKDYENTANEMENVILVPFQKEVDIYFAGADVYFLTSREDPFPSVVLEAMEVGIPVIAFNNNGGYIELVKKNGFLIDDIYELKECFDKLNNEKFYNKISIKSQSLIRERFNFIHYVFDLLNFLNENIKKISVIVPNYNYARYIKERLLSICNQTYPIFEIIFLDDKSNDNSVDIAKDILKNCEIPYKIILNDKNSGNPFLQWIKGIKEAKGDFIWIAEADDIANEDLLKNLSTCFDNKKVILAYSQSYQINEKNEILSSDYLEYTNDISDCKWRKNYINNGKKEIKEALSIKNTIPNVSAVVFKNIFSKEELENLEKELKNFQIAGDWWFYIQLLKKGDICYYRDSLNYHRRHKKSIIHMNKNKIHFDEFVRIQEYVIKNFDIDENILKKIKFSRKQIKEHLNIK
jgi:glycosyltransferase involved in cell wall biosynthesis